jgi:hypothetical protein
LARYASCLSIAVADETGAAPLVVLPSAVPMLREQIAPPERHSTKPSTFVMPAKAGIQ